MPISTTFVTWRSRVGCAPSVRVASHTWPTISAALRLRLKPWAPVEQKLQSSAQPTWLEMHSVPRSGSGMNTISIGLAVACGEQPLARAVGRLLLAQHFGCADLGALGRAPRAASATGRSSRRRRRARSCRSSASPDARGRASRRAETKNASSSVRGSPSRLSRSADMDGGSRFSARGFARLRRRRRSPGAPSRAVRAVHDVALDALREIGADRAARGLLRIGGAHDLAILRDRVLAFEHLHHDRARGHVAHEIGVERALAMHRVEALALLAREPHHARGDDAQPRGSKRE